MDAYEKIKAYIDHNAVTILGTINPDNSPHGAVVYTCADDDYPVVYFITKRETTKYTNLKDHDSVSLTMVNPAKNSTLQASGRAFEVGDPAIIDMVMKKLTHVHATAKDWMPPIAKLRAGAYVVIGIALTRARLAEFEGMTIGDERIFTDTSPKK